MIVILLLLTSCSKVDKVASVGGEYITRDEFLNELAVYNTTYYQTIQGKNEIIDGLVTRKILYMEAKKRRLTKEEKNKINEFVKRYKEQMQKFIDDYRLELLVNELRNNEWMVKEQEIDDFARKNKYSRFSHILVNDKEKADAVYSVLSVSKDKFAQIAKLNSIDEASAKNGGDIGYFIKGQLPESLEQIFELKEGEISKPIFTSQGWHIFKKTDEIQLDPLKHREAIKNAITVLKMKEYIARKKKEYKVRIY